MFCVELRGESCKLRPKDSGGRGTGMVRACVRWPWKVVNQFSKRIREWDTGYLCAPEVER